MDTKYNGWTNYSTWRVNLEFFDGFIPSDNGYNTTDTYELSEQLKEYVEDYLIQDTKTGLAIDYALAFIRDVNWYEIAEHLINDGE